jgi:CDP-paratose 2-epimerase
MRILITGGAGFVGSRLAFLNKEAHPDTEVVVFDNLKRRGSELNLPAFKKRGIDYIHGDIRVSSDLSALKGTFDLLVEASAEPSVLAGMSGSPDYLIQTNLNGTLNCLEWVRSRSCPMIFLSTSRVYSIVPLKELALNETASRFSLDEKQIHPGVSADGIDENFPTHLPRSLYGATKLASEMMIQEYVHAYGIKAVVNRCGVIFGAGQMGKVDQGVFTLWVARHFYGKPLSYTGFGGGGKQVRDLLHPSDLFRLIEKQVAQIADCSGEVFNVGGGVANTISLKELTSLCETIVRKKITMGSDARTNPVDIPFYATNNHRVSQRFDWRPETTVPEIVTEIHEWLRRESEALSFIFN